MQLVVYAQKCRDRNAPGQYGKTKTAPNKTAQTETAQTETARLIRSG